MTRKEGREAFELNREPTGIRELYGMNLSRTCYWPVAWWRPRPLRDRERMTGQAPHDKKPAELELGHARGKHGHGQRVRQRSYGMGFCLPRLDQARLHRPASRGLMDDTLVVVR